MTKREPTWECPERIAGPAGSDGPAGQPGAPSEDGSPGADGLDGQDGQDYVSVRKPFVAPWATIHGRSYSEWAVEWWQWAASMEGNEQHPLVDGTGERCGNGNDGPVWFLGGAFNESATATRSCEVPADVMLFFPLVNIASDNVDADPERSCEELTSNTELLAKYPTNLSVEIDGVPIGNLHLFRTWQTSCFELDYVQDSLLGAADGSAGTELSAELGYYLMLKPLAPGDHVLHFTGGWSFTEADHGFDEIFQAEITYHLTVVDGPS